MYNVHFAGMKIGTIHLTESALKLPQELVIPNDQIQLLNSIGQGEPSCMDYSTLHYATSLFVYMPAVTVHHECEYYERYIFPRSDRYCSEQNVAFECYNQPQLL